MVILVSVASCLAARSAASFHGMLAYDGVRVVLIVHPARDSVVASWFACLACRCSVEGSSNASIAEELSIQRIKCPGIRLGWYIVMFLRASKQACSSESYTSFRFPKWQLCVER
jgi:hypothetical protein